MEATPGTGTLDRRATSRPKPAICSLQIAVFLALLIALVGCAHRKSPPPTTVPKVTVAPPGTVEKGIASWYGEPYHGRRTASGEVYDMNGVSASHRTLPFGTVVRVTRRDTGQAVEVRINDRGPFIEGRIIDLSYGAARKIDLDVDGIAPVKVEVLRRTAPPQPESRRSPPATESGCWWVQVGAFAEIDNARRAERVLEGAGERAVVLEAGAGLYRVRVGPVESETQAEMVRKRIRDAWPEAQVVGCGG
jgi:rare lipoprotein A